MNYTAPRLYRLADVPCVMGGCVDGMQAGMVPSCTSGTEASGRGGCVGGAAAEYGCMAGALAGTGCGNGAGNDPEAPPPERRRPIRRSPARDSGSGAV